MRYLLLASLVLLGFTAQAQYNFQSCLLDSTVYAQVPLAAPLMRGDYHNLPQAFSLKKYAPRPQNQGDLGNCVGWTSAYMARTILWAQHHNYTNTDYITAQAFSPFFVYEYIKAYDDRHCKTGATLFAALEALRELGTVKMQDFAQSCNQVLSSALKQKAREFRIESYKRLFVSGTKDKVPFVKKSIAEGKPVMIGIQCCVESFLNAADSVWLPNAQDDFKSLNPQGGHAVTVVGYDDKKYGGAFEIMNSWGTDWGNKGFLWVRYQDFNDFCFEAYEMAIPQDMSEQLAGEISLKLSAGSEMQAVLKSGVYETKQAYRSGTLFRMYLANYQPAYIYIFASDLNKQHTPLFPYEPGISPFLGYQMSNLALPSEEHYIEMDEVKGLDYYCILYSKEKLHLPSLLEMMSVLEGNFQERLYKVLGSKLIPPTQQRLSEQKIGFIAATNQGSVMPVIIAIPHH
jgi:hypothetical protein